MARQVDPTLIRHGPVNAVYHWAAEQIVSRRLATELRTESRRVHAALRLETQSLRDRTHDKLMRGLLDPEVFTGGARVVDEESSPAQTRLRV